MVKLIRGNVARLWKTRSFWVCVILSFVVSVGNLLGSYVGDKECVRQLGRLMAKDSSYILLFAAIFIALFLGTDYSDGTIRNKLIVGRTRTEIYFSNLLTAAFGSLIIGAAAWFSTLCTGLVLGGEIGIPTEEMLLIMLVSVCALAAMSAVYTLVGMLIAKKSSITVITLVLTFGLIIGAGTIQSLLFQPEYVTNYTITENGPELREEKNLLYLEGAKRDFYTLINDIFPCGQIVQLETGKIHNAKLLPVYSLAFFVASTAVGTVIFRKKDLK